MMCGPTALVAQLIIFKSGVTGLWVFLSPQLLIFGLEPGQNKRPFPVGIFAIISHVK